MKIAAHFLTPLYKAIETSIEEGAIPKNGKITSVPPDKSKDNKNRITNFWPVGILNFFSKSYWLVIYERTNSMKQISNFLHCFSLQKNI